MQGPYYLILPHNYGHFAVVSLTLSWADPIIPLRLDVTIIEWPQTDLPMTGV